MLGISALQRGESTVVYKYEVSALVDLDSRFQTDAARSRYVLSVSPTIDRLPKILYQSTAQVSSDLCNSIFGAMYVCMGVAVPHRTFEQPWKHTINAVCL